ncbi:MAG TPA: hypothetical protein DCY93_02115 [Firmicutes bacterium]|nr:hypothetical protein [Bacillota bacterium]
MYYQDSYYYLVPMTHEQMNSYLKNSSSTSSSINMEEMRKGDKKEDMDLYSPLDGLVRGNMFKNEYRGYKDYQPGIVKPRDERTQLLLDVMMYGNAAHDVALKLDVYPKNQDLIKSFEEFNEKLKKAKMAYESKYGPLTKSSAKGVNGEFDWTNVRSPWLEM